MVHLRKNLSVTDDISWADIGRHLGANTTDHTLN